MAGESDRWRTALSHEQAHEGPLIGMVAALAAELSATRERVDTLERLLAERGLIAADAVEAFQPDARAAAARDATRHRLIDRVFGVLGRGPTG